LFGFLVLAHDRRRVVHFNVTTSPTAQWTAQQIVEAFPWESAPRYLLRDRDSIFGGFFRSRVRGMGIEEVLIAYRSPWQSPFVKETDRVYPSRVPRPRHRVGGEAPAANPRRVLPLLPPVANAPLSREGLSGAEGRAGARDG